MPGKMRVLFFLGPDFANMDEGDLVMPKCSAWVNCPIVFFSCPEFMDQSWIFSEYSTFSDRAIYLASLLVNYFPTHVLCCDHYCIDEC